MKGSKTTKQATYGLSCHHHHSPRSTNSNLAMRGKTKLVCGYWEIIKEARELLAKMGNPEAEVYFVFLNFDPEYERLRANQFVISNQHSNILFSICGLDFLIPDESTKGSAELDAYLSSKHDQLLQKLLQPNTYKKRSSLAIVDGFAVEITEKQAAILRSAKEVRVVEKNQELA